MFRWLLANRLTNLPPVNEAIQLFQPHNINIYDINSLNKVIDEEISFLNWPITVNVGSENGLISIQITGVVPEINNFYANLIALYLANSRSPQKISKLMQYPASIYIVFQGAANHEEAAQSIYETFGDNKTDKIPEQNDMMLVHA